MSDENTGKTVKQSPYSPKILRLVAQIQEAPSPNDRANLLMALAAQFNEEHDPTDPNLEDGYHFYFEDYHNRRTKFQQAALRLGRLALHEVQGYLNENDLPMPVAVKGGSMAN